jgi:hypothetical protein
MFSHLKTAVSIFNLFLSMERSKIYRFLPFTGKNAKRISHFNPRLWEGSEDIDMSIDG